MASGPGIVMTATMISFSNEWWQTNDVNVRIPVAGLFFALLDAGISDVSPAAGTGLAVLMFITVMVTPIKGQNSPLGSLAGLVIATPKKG